MTIAWKVTLRHKEGMKMYNKVDEDVQNPSFCLSQDRGLERLFLLNNGYLRKIGNNFFTNDTGVEFQIPFQKV